jgi:membrane dipeptidase
MIVLDAHEDIAYNALRFNRDYRRSAYEIRQQEGGTSSNGIATVGLPNALLGHVALVFPTLFTAPKGSSGMLADSPTYETPRQAYDLALKQLDYYQRLADETETIRLITTRADLDAVLATWADDAPSDKRQQGFVILMENADPILEPKQFEEWYEHGVRLVGPAWTGTRYCGGTGMPGGLTALGRELLEIMAGLNAILDLSHMAEQAFLEAVDAYEGIVIASHSNPRKFRNSDRHLSDEMIRLLGERDGVMGIVPYNRFLSDTWTPGDAKLPFAVVLDAIDHVCQVTGSAAHVGIGSDFDGGFGAASIPDGMDTVTDLLTISSGLRGRGYAENDIEAIMSGNFLRKLHQALR